ncbi:hypothetical protein AAG906_029214 [Vitis piasezkii]
MCIQETKIQVMSEGIVRSLGSGRFLDWRALNAEGAAGGILICWDKRVLEIVGWEEGQFSLSCRFKTIENGATWVFTGVYGPFTKVEREAMRRFAESVDDLELVDLPLQGGEFTWSGGLNNHGVTQAGYLANFDHFPIVLEGGGIRRGPTQFRFENMWLKVKGFNDIVRTWWQGIEVRGSASYRLAVKMKEIKKKLKVWNKEVFGRLETNKASALHQRALSMEEAELKRKLKIPLRNGSVGGSPLETDSRRFG